ncbi:monosaccharide transporter [Zychaea mexicana]|uniref:monosaccharide transporter n=1 Tax=Zychaea mexicana TaxID=64656 RepID=UPI0022FDD209|nr:monosaccharide transporter [Zychaea mexicana]KAI9498308.1 monosaccharide transporter [Zychaea mexicana]
MDSRTAGLRPFVVFCVVIASVGAFSNGINTSSLNIPGDYVKNCPDVPVGEVTYFEGSSIPKCIPMGDWIWGVATGMFAVGGLLGALASGPLAERFGRRDSMLMMNTTFFIGAALLSTSTTSGQFAVGRIFVGAGSGFMTVVISMYIAEVAPPPTRGALGCFLQLFMTFGILLIQAIGLGLRSSVGWRVATVITVAPAIVQMALLPFCPRSPRWLISRGRIDEARAELLRLRNGDIEEEFADMILGVSTSHNEDTKKALAEGDKDSAYDNEKASSNANSGSVDTNLSFFQVIRIPVLAWLTLKMCIVHASSQLNGINAIMYYSTNIFATSFDGDAPYVTVGVAGLNVVVTIIGLLLVDRLGRKFLLLFSSMGMCLFAAIMTIALRFEVSALQVVCVMLFVSSFAVGLGTIPFLITAEVYPTYAVGAASSAALVINWLCNFIIGLVFPALQSACGPYVFLIFTGIAAASSVFMFFYVPETKRKSIEDIGRSLGWYDLDIQQYLNKKK